MQSDNSYDFHYYPASEAAKSSEVIDDVSHVFSNSFGNTPEGKSYRLGPKTTKNESNVRTTSLFHGITLILSGTSMPGSWRLHVESLDGSTLSRSEKSAESLRGLVSH